MPARLQSVLLDLAFAAGLGLVAVGVGVVYVPAGLVVAGVELAGGAFLLERGA